MTQLGTIEYGVEIQDNDIERQMAAANARVEAGLRRIDSKEAQFKIRANLKELQKDLKEAELMVKKAEKERAALGEGDDKRAAANRLRAAKAERDEREKLLRVAQQAGMARAKEMHDSQMMAERQNVLIKGEKERGRIAKENAGNPEKEKLQVLQLQKEWAKLTDEAEKLHKARKKAFTGETKQKIDIDEKIVFAKMELIKKTLSTMGGHPPVHIKVDTNFDIRSPVRSLGRMAASALGGLGEKLANVGNLRLNLGPLSGTIRTFAIALATLGPVVASLTGGIGALIGVVGTGLAGAGAVGAAALTGLGLSAAGLFLTIKPLATQFKTAQTATAAYNTAVLKYGEGSKQATKAQQAMNNTLKGVSPEVRAAAKDLSKMQIEWAKLTGGKGGATHNLGAILADGFKTAHAIMPTLAKGTNELSKNLRSAFGGIFEGLRSQGAKSGIATIMSNFNKAIVPAVGGLQNFGTAFGRIAVSASRFLTPTALGFEHLGQRFLNLTSNSTKLNSEVNRLVGHAQSLIRFFGAAGRVMVTFFNAGAGSGQKLVDTMTAALNRWNAFMKTPAGRKDIKDFFDRSVQGTLGFVHAIGPLLKAFTEWTTALQPVTTGMLEFISFISKIIGGLTHLAVFGPTMKALGFTIAAAFAVGKIASFVGMIQTAITALGGLVNRWRGVGVAASAAAVEERAAAAAGMTAGSPLRGGAPVPAGGVRGALGRGLGRAARVAPFGLTAAFAGSQMGGRSGAALTGAGIGATIGSVLPGPGTLVGGAVGLIAGATSQMSAGKVKEMKAFGDGFKDVAAKMALGGNAAKNARVGLVSLSEHIRTEGAGKKIQADAKRFAQSTLQMQSNVAALRNGAAGSITDLRNRFAQNLGDIEALTQKHSAGARRALDSNMNAAFINLRQLLHDGHMHTATFLGQIKDLFASNLAKTGRITHDNFNNIVSTIRGGMKDGSISTRAGMKAIRDYAIQYLTNTLHINPANVDIWLKRGGDTSNTAAVGGSGGGPAGSLSGNKAVGGWVGNPRAAGADNIGVVVGEGEAIINRHQIPIVDHALHGIGVNGLSELFRRVQVPHSHEAPRARNQGTTKWFAQGGFAAGGPVQIGSGSPVGAIEGETRAVLGAGVGAVNQSLEWIKAHQATIPQTGKAPNPRLTSLGNYLVKQGFGVAEHPNFGGVHPGHESYGAGDHYHGGAIDVGAIGAGPHHRIQAIAWMDHMEHHLDFYPTGMISTHPSTPVSWYRGDHADHVHISAHEKGGFAQKFASGGWVTPQHWGRHDSSGSNIDQSTNLKTGQWAHGEASHFGSPWEAGPSTGISTPFGNARGGYWLMHAPNGNWAIEKQTDAGPNLGLKRMFDLTQGSMHDLGSGDGGGYQGMFLGRSTHGYHTGRIGKGQGAYLAATLGGGRGAEKQITMWDDRNMHHASHPASYWKHLDAKYPRARAHWHTTARAAQKIYDRNKAKKGAAGTGVQGASFLTEGMYGITDYDFAKAGLTDTTEDDRKALRARQQIDVKEIARLENRKTQDERILKRGYWLDKHGHKHKLTAAERARITAELPQLRTDLTGLYGDLKSTNDTLGPLDLAAAMGITTQTGITGANDTGGGAGGGAATDADLAARLAQSETNLAAARSDSAINAAFAQVAGGFGDIGMGRFTSARSAAQQNDGPTIIVNTLHPGDPNTLRAIGAAAVSGMGYQGGRTSPRDATL